MNTLKNKVLSIIKLGYILLAARIWLLTNLIICVGILIYFLVMDPGDAAVALVAFPAGLAFSSPYIPLMTILAWWLEKNYKARQVKVRYYIGVTLGLSTLFDLAVFLIMLINEENPEKTIWFGLISISLLYTAILTAGYLSASLFIRYFSDASIHIHKTTHQMESESVQFAESQSSRTLVKGLITGGLILIMMIPTIFISNLVRERQARQKQVSDEVSSKWASAQTLSGPFLFVPYTYNTTDAAGKTVAVSSHFWILPENLQVNGDIDHQIRLRSIYKVLLYRAQLSGTGNLKLQLPKDIAPDQVTWPDVKVCVGISDFKGIESKVIVKLGDTETELAPGLPDDSIIKSGLSAPANLQATDLGKTLDFSTKLTLKGSGSLHFLPLSGNSMYSVQSKWPAPSFDGNNLPSERTVSDAGFSAKWIFNKANLPFSTVLRDTKFDIESLAFGVTMLQPADQYAKTERTVKYAILIIGLTFSLFFIVELMQKKPVHPVQYVLIGLALIIFYTLLLSISEFILFDYAYLVAAFATIGLISMYVRSHFGNWRAVAMLSGVLVLLYTFIFVLVRLEDTALLIGSLGLFVILAISMYASRKINWYGVPESRTGISQ